MSTKATTRHLVRGPRPSESVQKRSAPPGAVTYVIGKEDVTRAVWLKSLRPGDIASMDSLSILAEPKGRKCPDVVRDLQAARKAVLKTGAVILETSTGRRTDDCEQSTDMLVDAIQQLRTGRRGGARVGTGRPKGEWTEAQVDLFDREWHSRKNETREGVIEAIRNKVGVDHAKKVNLTAVRRALKRAGKID